MKKISLLSVVIAVTIAVSARAQIVFKVENPASLQGDYNFTFVDDDGASGGSSGWGVDMDTYPAVTDTLVIISDGTSADSLGCNATVNTTQINGNIAVVYRGACEFGKKAYEAQLAGARAVVIVNNQPGGPVGMGPGMYGASVTIPVVMISMEDAALFRPSIDAGQLIAFIGNKIGLFSNDAGITKADIAMAGSTAIPKQIAQDATDFQIPVSATVTNYGINDQSNVTLSADITRDGTLLYSQSSGGNFISSGTSSFITLPAFALSSYTPGYYTLTYNVTIGTTDDDPSDNKIVTNFWINDSIYAKARIDSVTKEPVTTAFSRPSGAFEYKWCTVMKEKNASRLKADAISFAASSTPTFPLTGQTIVTQFYEWQNDISSPFDNIYLLHEEWYTYSSDLQKEFVKVPFSTPVVLSNNSKYLSCLWLYTDSIYIGYDTRLDYNTNLNIHIDTNSYFPIEVDGTWYSVGFGTDAVPSILLHTSENILDANFTANNTTACTGSTITFSNLSSGGITSYAWDFGSGATPATATGPGPHNVSYSTTGTKTVSLTIGNGTTTDTETKTNYITVNTAPAQPGAISGSTSICEGSTQTYSITAVSGATSYTWTLPSGWSGSSSSTSISATAGTSGGTIYVTANNNCGSSSAQFLNVTVSPLVAASVSIDANNTTICPGETVTFTATPTNGGSSPSYQWQINGANAGTNSSTFSTSTLNDGDVVTVIMTSNAVCATGSPATSNAITITVTSSLTPSVSIAADINPACSGTLVTFTATSSGGGASPSYQWKINGANAGTNSSIFSSSTLANGDEVSVVMTSSATCATVSTATSNIITMNIVSSATASVSISASANPACAGDAVTYTAAPVNGGSTPFYQWKRNGNNVGTNSSTYATSTLVSGDQVVVEMTSSLSCAINSPATSNTVTMTINSPATASVTISADQLTVCTGNPVTFTATSTNGGASPSYQWRVNGNNTGTNSSTYTSNTLVNNDNISVVMTSSESCVTGSPAASNVLAITVNPLPNKPEILQSGNVIGSSVSAASYQWSFNGSIITGAQSQFYTASASGFYTVTITDINGCSVTSDPKDIQLVGMEEISGTAGFEVFPNPNKGIFTLNLELKEKSDVVLNLLDMQGRLIMSEQMNASGKLSREIDISGHSTGVYHLQVITGNGIVNKKIVLSN